MLVGALNLLTRVDTSGLTTGLEKMRKRISRFARSGQGMLAGLGVGISAYGLIDFLGQSTAAAADLEESLSKVGVIFGPQASLITDAADRMAERFGTVKREYIDAAAQFGMMFKGIGLAQQESANLGNQLAVLGMDLASFFNAMNEEVFTALAAALRGEFDPLERFGVFLTADAVKLKAVEKGLAASTGEVDEQAKKLTILSEILAQTTDAQGDLERTSGSTANQARKLKGDWTNFRTELGQELIPVMRDGIKLLYELGAAISGTFNDEQTGAINGFAAGLQGIVDNLRWMASGDFLGGFSEGLDMIGAWVTSFAGLAPNAASKAFERRLHEIRTARARAIVELDQRNAEAKAGQAKAAPINALEEIMAAQQQTNAGLTEEVTLREENNAAIEEQQRRLEELAAWQREHAGRTELATMGSQDAYRTISAFRGPQATGKAAEETAKNTRAQLVEQMKTNRILRGMFADAPPVAIAG